MNCHQKYFSDLQRKAILILYFPKWEIHQNVKISLFTVGLVVCTQTDMVWFKFADNLTTHGTAVMLVRTLLSSRPSSTSFAVSLALQEKTKQTVLPTSVNLSAKPVSCNLTVWPRGSELRGTSWAASSFAKTTSYCLCGGFFFRSLY